MNDAWIIPNGLDLAHYETVEPVLISDSNGSVFIKPNAILLRNGINFDEDNDDSEDYED